MTARLRFSCPERKARAFTRFGLSEPIYGLDRPQAHDPQAQLQAVGHLEGKRQGMPLADGLPMFGTDYQ